ncbi:HAD-IB family hydrolase [Pedobacter hartonius]|uniref:HAD-superfamily subfamily IB hydrolase, TIGR01490 n=1 Tax=Pedobacter hartonius TaxID=425514 RepID=A0A1H4GHW1_9SPHI|nr:HAD-IB family hydrolase [Pedobacter hartonius]SEB09186.1 HAD-superfamily subfamily IB hydrolase, TIGR01490 [Pedobacter hartonius]
MSDKKVLAVFDFDGTITKRDTLPVFIRFAVTLTHLLTGSLFMVPFVLLFKLKVIPNYKAKERLFKTFFAGLSIDKFDNLSRDFVANIEQIVNPVALEKVRWHQQMGHEVIIISASVENWISPWANKYGIKTVLATGLQLKNDTITGNFLSKNCHGPEKVNRLLEKYPERDKYVLYAYGDSNGDKELLALADHAFYRSF